MKNELRLISMSEIQTEKVRWLWYPYIPLGKLTIVQGDPGEGKTSFVLAVIAALTRGDPLPECEAAEPINVIYQTAEDGLADTIKPRLEMSGADCSRVLVIDESSRELTLCDTRLERAIRETGARLIVLDPLQAYLGNDVDIHRANEVRPVMKQVAAVAERTQCVVILIGHMNKAQGLKSGYRGLGSIDFRALFPLCFANTLNRYRTRPRRRCACESACVRRLSESPPRGPRKIEDFVGRGGRNGAGEVFAAGGNEAERNFFRRGGASIAPGYTPDALAGALLRRPPAPKGEMGRLTVLRRDELIDAYTRLCDAVAHVVGEER